jgi:hypothetical protein
LLATLADISPGAVSHPNGYGPVVSMPAQPAEEKPSGAETLRAASSTGRRASTYSGLQVIRFHIWQDLTASSADGLAPLHATVTLEMTDDWYMSLSKPGGRIKINTLRERDTLEGNLLVYQAHYALGLGQPGSRQLQFMMAPTPLYPRLAPNEVVRGTARMKFEERQLTIHLPETKVIFTR